MFGFFDDPFFTTDSRHLMNLLLNNRAYGEDDDEKGETQCDKKCETKAVGQCCKHNDWTTLMNWSPRSDVRETEHAYVIAAELPGVPKDGVKIEVKDNVLTVSGKKETMKEWCSEKEDEKEVKEGEGKKEENMKKEKKNPIWHRMERTYGSFQRSFALPEGVDVTKIAASSKDGILTITIPKPEVKQPKVHTIAITEC